MSNNVEEIMNQLEQMVRADRAIPLELEEQRLSLQERDEITALMERMQPVYQRLDEVLPIYLQLSSNIESAKRMIALKYLYEDQLEILYESRFILTLMALQRIQDQFHSCFAYVRTTITAMAEQQQRGI
ncbi:hypothetical protein BDB00DRAFT_868804 [Zychaea mexicana]|uniref:uncharacterized protein n=1 Tax=Zychaea mexicana TaxID=64656 RepID=UPI0022FEDC13|nr:uncharacterized protein BDB00DRAFT_868804 [Zychaea mexicana]KAI9496958.1 hypothetical protein BDB00DRAFT_868804 [Zychaea mexicana]